jgi:hypothetical protein
VILASLVLGLGVAVWPGPASPEAAFHAAHEVEAPPAMDASASTWNAWAGRAVDVAVGWQAAALVEGDEEAFLASVDPEDTRLRGEQQRRFEVLRQMGVGQWSQEVRGRPDVTGELSWHAEVRVTYCFGDPECRPNTIVIGTDWRLAGDRLVLTAMDESGEDQIGPRPWESQDVAVATGPRTVVVSSERLDYRLEATLEAAEQAAAAADPMAQWDGPPSRYVVFLAGSADWADWYGFEKPGWAAGVYVNRTDNEVLINSVVVRPQDMVDTLTHEFTHVATFAGPRDGRSADTWWLEEGIADYVAMIDRPVSAYNGLSTVRSFIHGTWDGDLVLDRPGDGVSPASATGRYGVAFLAVRRLADGHGHDAMVEFFGAVVHHGKSLDEAAQEAFGESWATVRADCVAYIRNV